jgi:hypothetical protein
MIGSERTVNIREMASWMNRDVGWLLHVIEYDYSCGCSIDLESDLAGVCAIWKAHKDKIRAEEAFEAAKKALENAKAASKAMEVG